MRNVTLGRRTFLQLAVFSGLLSLSGCSFSTTRPKLLLPRGVLPLEFLRALSSPWRYEFLDAQSNVDAYKSLSEKNADLVALGDGWLKKFPHELLQSIDVNALYDRLSNPAIAFLNSLGAPFASKVFPLAFSPWVLVFRRGGKFLPRANESWEVLLDPDLKGQVILPTSPRLIMTLAKRMSYNDSLRRLRLQARSFDDRNGLNWLLSGKAKVAVLPLQDCLTHFKRDPRLSIALPKEGCPLNWTLLLRPESSVEPFPSSWIQQSWRLPLLVDLLSMGVVPPLPYEELSEAIDLLPQDFQEIYKYERLLKNAWSLPLLNLVEEKVLEERWVGSTP